MYEVRCLYCAAFSTQFGVTSLIFLIGGVINGIFSIK